ncbi:ER membrane protein complex subunit 4-like [Haliotis rubra]|uniref:ER membrane protein complex subunit 4-like n=1 Tax=Haliotis rufescens TaxID=6454 RepID=UPI001EAF9574|nr:ER membrane protein complex subunit 4-like [Haliotis rufescens]XP_046557108.1 ER membrane protein complex subunit 4-like [Haliotis rubra]XP_046575516.1 ER membrane protein complex subunit 4-like [Haliotis rubra]
MATRKRHKWAIDFLGGGKSRSDRALVQFTELQPPVGYVDTVSVSEKAKDADPKLIVKRSWDIALGPIKQVPMNMFIMWMAGNSISIFPIMMVGMMFFRPIQTLFGIQNTFKMIEGDQAAFQKFVYLLGNLLCLAMAIYKCQVMGLLPSHASDWLAFVQPQERMEWSGGGVMM